MRGMRMRVKAEIIETRRDGESSYVGEYEFVELPRVGDRIRIPTPMDEDIWQVRWVDHRPVKTDPDTATGRMVYERGPKATVYVWPYRPKDPDRAKREWDER
jgi:hypothetical protein